MKNLIQRAMPELKFAQRIRIVKTPTPIIALAVSTSTLAAERLVPSQYPTIQAAIDAAANGDFVRISPGTYIEALEMNGKALTIAGDPSAASVILRPAGNSKIVTIADNAAGSSSFRNLTFTGGVTQNVVTVTAGNPTFEYCLFRDNQAAALLDSRACGASEGATLRHCLFLNNGSPNGGATYLYETNSVFEDCVFAGNRATGPTGGVNAGGACYVNDWGCGTHTFRFSRCIFTDNSAVWGGAIYAQGTYPNAPTRLIIDGCTFANNSASSGSAIFNWYITCPVAQSSYCGPGDHIRNGWSDGGENAFYANCSPLPFPDCNGDGVPDSIQTELGLLPDRNGDGIPDGCQCIGDIVANGQIDGADLAAVVSNWGPASASGISRACDTNGDGAVSGADLGFLLTIWGPCR